ncbi:DcaP family trimeric outer membrane transporter [Halobacteriovorax sp. RZ-2]|uniref:DcaP family trimeric outer membrane transporter n=1 Tax=unclassified Halobacteriovorax TaxID=2639665 RepID=UPI00371CBFB5
MKKNLQIFILIIVASFNMKVFSKDEVSDFVVQPGEIRDYHRVDTGTMLENKDFPGSWPMFGTDMRMKIGGYFKADIIGDFDGSGDKDQFLISKIPVDGTPEANNDGYFNALIRETRFNFDIRKNTAGEPPQQFFLEMDYFDTDKTYARVRHAYFVYGKIVVGQTWTNLSELRSLPFMIDFAYGDALYGGRTVQLRWQDQVSSSTRWAIALEKITEAAIDNPANFNGEAVIQLPSLSARIDLEREDGFIMLGTQIAQLKWDGQNIGKDATATQWSAVFAGRQYFGQKRSYFTWNISYGDGAGATILALAGSNANATLVADGILKTNKGYSATFGYAFKLTDTLSTNFAIAWTELEKSSQRPDDAIAGGGVLHVNLIKELASKVSTGVEYMYGVRVNNNDDDGDASRIQAMIKFDF